MAGAGAPGSGPPGDVADDPEGPEFEGTARLGRALKGRMARRAIAAQQDPDADDAYSVGELLALDTLEHRMETRREFERLREMTRDPDADG